MTFREQLQSAAVAKSRELKRKMLWSEVIDLAEKIHNAEVGEVLKKHPTIFNKKAAELTDAEWVASLEVEPHLSGVNIKREINACQFWCKNNKKLPTRRRILNWLAKAERVVDLKASGAQYATGLKIPPAPGPDGWLAWVADNIPPEDEAAWGQVTAAYNCQQFHMLPGSYQSRCRGALSK